MWKFSKVNNFLYIHNWYHWFIDYNRLTFIKDDYKYIILSLILNIYILRITIDIHYQIYYIYIKNHYIVIQH